MDIVTLAAAKSYSKTYTDSAISGISGGITYKGAVNYYSDLPNNPEQNDSYTVLYAGTSGDEPDGTQYVWTEYEGTLQWVTYGINRSLLKTYQTFRSNWTTDGTIAQFCSDVNADPNATEGMGYVGELTCSDLPFVGNADAVVEIVDGTGTSNKVIHIILTSGNVYPYRWEYTYWSNGLQVSGWIGTQPEVLTVIYTNTSGTITCNQEWQTIKDAIDSNRPIQGYYEDLTDVPSKVYSIKSFLYLPMSTSSSILCDCGLISTDSSGYITIKKIFDGLQSNVRTTYITSVPYRVLPSVTSSDNDKILGVVSGNWSKTPIKTINNQSLIGSGNIDIPDNELFIITVDRSSGYYTTDVSYADARAAYNAGKMLFLKLTERSSPNIATLYEVDDDCLRFSYSPSASTTETWEFHSWGLLPNSLYAVREVNGKRNQDVRLDLQFSIDGFIWIEGSSNKVWSSMVLHTIAYNEGGAMFAQLWATTLQALASASECHLKIANPAVVLLPMQYVGYYQQYGQTLGLIISLVEDNTQAILGIPCGGGLDSGAGTIALQFRAPVSQLGTDVAVSAVLTITTDGVIYIDAEKISGYTDLGGKTLSELTTEIQTAFEALSYSDYEAMEEGQTYTISGYSWECGGASSSGFRSLSGFPETVSCRVEVYLDPVNETVDSVNVLVND